MSEIELQDDSFIVSKTDSRGKITYGNRYFIEISGYTEAELLGSPHNIIRHPDMPRAVFALMWRTLQQGEEFFGYIKNRTKQGDFYWAFANVTPSYDPQGKLSGYYSVRRKPKREAIQTFTPLYHSMLQEEAKHTKTEQALSHSDELLNTFLNDRQKSYEEFAVLLQN